MLDPWVKLIQFDKTMDQQSNVINNPGPSPIEHLMITQQDAI